MKYKPLDLLLDWIFPPICMACRHILPLNNQARVLLRLCEYCEDLFEPLTPPFCECCGLPFKTNASLCGNCMGKAFFFTQNRAAFAYEDLLRDLMHEIKFRNRKPYAVGLGRLWARVSSEADFSDIDYIVPVPMYYKKQRERGFNQADEMARPLAERFNIALVADMLIRTRHTTPQSSLNSRSRAENVYGSFKFNPLYEIMNKKIVLIDDIYTTGASLNECARVLVENGAANVICKTLSITLKKNKRTDDKNNKH